jgi:hypothetical protein
LEVGRGRTARPRVTGARAVVVGAREGLAARLPAPGRSGGAAAHALGLAAVARPQRLARALAARPRVALGHAAVLAAVCPAPPPAACA